MNDARATFDLHSIDNYVALVHVGVNTKGHFSCHRCAFNPTINIAF